MHPILQSIQKCRGNSNIFQVFYLQIDLLIELAINFSSVDENLQLFNNPKPMIQEICVVLFGSIGNGKTTLFNKLTDSNEPVSTFGPSCTRLMTKKYDVSKRFFVIDTPGFGNVDAPLTHMAGILAALKQGPIRRIFLVVEAQNREPNLVEEITKIALPFKRYMNLTTIIVTKLDSQQLRTQFQSAYQEVIRNKLGIKSLILTGKDDDQKKICQMIWSEVQTSKKQESIELTPQEKTIYFQRLERRKSPLQSKAETDLIKSKQDFITLLSSVQFYIEKKLTKDDLETDNKLHALTLFVKQQAQQFVDEYAKAHGDEMEEIFVKTNDIDFAYNSYVELKRNLFENLKQAIREINKKMFNKPQHVFNYLKKCPNPRCGLVWLKTGGCTGETTCGNFGEDDPNFIPELRNKYKVTYTKEKEIVIEEEINQNMKIQFEYAVKKPRVGCGMKLTWDQFVPLTELQQQEIYESAAIDFLLEGQLDYNEKIFETQVLKLVAEQQKNLINQTTNLQEGGQWCTVF